MSHYLLHEQVDGINLLHIPARDMTAYGRSLLDVLISKEKQASSVVINTKQVLNLAPNPVTSQGANIIR